MVAVDEAHRISDWGHDFRPYYRNLMGLKQRFKGIPVLALTAAATPRVKADIIEQLALQDPLERIIEASEICDPEIVDQQRQALRRMFDLADGGGGFWRRLVGHFAEVIAACGEPCGNCSKRDLLAEAQVAATRERSRQRPELAPAMPLPDQSLMRGDQPQAAGARPFQTISSPELFDRLRALRKRLADERKVPAYVVFNDRTLQDMAERRPRTLEKLLEVHGVGQKKLEEYGEDFLTEISQER